jgi:hypothetical protein
LALTLQKVFMKHPRRVFLRFAGGAGAMFFAAATGLIKTATAWGAPWNKNVFEARGAAETLKGLGVNNQSTAVTSSSPHLTSRKTARLFLLP